MKRFIVSLFIFLIIINPTIANSNSIQSKTNFFELIKCDELNFNFSAFVECVDQELLTSTKLASLNFKKRSEINDIIAIINILNESVIEEFIDNKTAFINFDKFLNSNFKSKSSNIKLEKILDQSNCKKVMKYEDFISCFNSEFRSYDIYQSANIKTKERIEHIVFNSMILTKPDGYVTVFKKEGIYGKDFEIEKTFEKIDGYKFFFSMMNALGTNFFEKPDYKVKKYNFKPHKEFSTKNKTNWGKVLKFILTAVIVAYAAKGLIKAVKGAGSTASTTSTSTSSTGSYSLSSSGVAAKGSLGRNLFRYAPKTSVLRKPWFKYTLMRGGF